MRSLNVAQSRHGKHIQTMNRVSQTLVFHSLVSRHPIDKKKKKVILIAVKGAEFLKNKRRFYFSILRIKKTSLK